MTHLAQQGKENGHFGLVQRFEYALSGKLKGHHDKTEKVNVQGRHCCDKKRGIMIEDPDKKIRKQSNQAQISSVYAKPSWVIKRMDLRTRDTLRAP
jgi:hypothetical protein